MKKNRKSVVAIVVTMIVAAALLVGCTSNNGPTGPGNGGNNPGATQPGQPNNPPKGGPYDKLLLGCGDSPNVSVAFDPASTTGCWADVKLYLQYATDNYPQRFSGEKLEIRDNDSPNQNVLRLIVSYNPTAVDASIYGTIVFMYADTSYCSVYYADQYLDSTPILYYSTTKGVLSYQEFQHAVGNS